MSRRSFKLNYMRFVSEYKKLEKEKKRCLKQYLDNQTLIQVHSANIIRSLNNILNVDMLELFRYSEELFFNRPVQREIWQINRRSGFWEEVVPTFTDEQFKSHFRMTRKSFNKLCSKLLVLTREDTKIRKAIPLDKRIAIALKTLGSCRKYKSVGDLFGVGRTTVGVIVMQFAKAVCDTLLEEYVDPQKLETIVGGFERLGIPQCYGVLGTCHIKISTNRSAALDYLNSKEWCSVVLLATVDHKGKFTSIQVGSRGSTNAQTIFEQSSLKFMHETYDLFKNATKTIGSATVPIFLVGNSSFRLSKHVMIPYANRSGLTDEAEMFNNTMLRCQSIILDTFEYLKARFAMISQGLEVRENNCNRIIKACCVLHNFLMDENDHIWSAWLNTLEERDNGSEDVDSMGSDESVSESDGLVIRESLTGHMYRQNVC